MWSMLDEIVRDRQEMLRAEAERAARVRRTDRRALGRLISRIAAAFRAPADRGRATAEPPPSVAFGAGGCRDGTDRRAA